MSDLDEQIQDLLAEGYGPFAISHRLEIPVDWVYLSMEIHATQ